MRARIPLKYFSMILLLVTLTSAICGVHGSAYASPCHESVVHELTSPADTSASRQSPSEAPEQHDDFDGCDTCVNCACHAPLIAQSIQLSYKPSVRDNVTRSTPFNFLPEVYLSLFVPPDSATA